MAKIEADEPKGYTSLVQSASFVKNSAWIVTVTGDLVSTHDGGENWTLISNKESGGFSCVYFINGELGFALSAKGIVLKTNDAGKTWKKTSGLTLNGGEVRYKSQIKFSDQLNGIIVMPGYVWTTSDGGTTWERRNPFEATKNIRVALTGGVSFVGNSIWLAGTEGIIFKSEDKGHNWKYYRVKNTDGLIYDVLFLNEKLGWTAGFPGLGLLKSEDGGSTWKLQHPFISLSKSVAVISLFFIDGQTGWAVGQDRWKGNSRFKGALLHTKDGGRSWQQISVGRWETILSRVHFSDSNEGWVISYDKVYKTKDGGLSWKQAYHVTK